MKIKRIICVISAVLLVAFALCSCGAGYAKSTQAAEMAYDDGATGYGFSKAINGISNYDSAADETVAETEYKPDGEEKSDYSAIADAASRKLIRDASLDVQTEQYDEFTANLNKEISNAGGYIQSSSESGSTYNYTRSRWQELEIRIPAEKLDAFLESVSSIATVTSKSISVRDITGQYIDTQSRIKALETEYEALLNILAKADKVSDLITVQNRLTDVNAELESCKSTLKTYDELVAYSTVSMSVSEVQRVTATEGSTFGQELRSRLSDNLYNISTGARDFAVWFLSSLPYIIIFAILALIIIFITRRNIKKRRIKKAKKAQQKTENEAK